MGPVKSLFVPLMMIVALAGAAKAETAFVGMQVQGVSRAVAAAFGIDKPEGVLVRDVALGGPADQSGIRRGDLIVSFAGTEIDTFERLVMRVRELVAGDSVPVRVLRQGERLDLTMTAGSWTPAWRVAKGASAAMPAVGLTLSALTPKVRERFDIRWGSLGVLISLIDPEKSGMTDLQRGDLIHQVNQRPVWEPAQVVRLYETARKQGRKSLLLLVESAGGFRFSILEVR